MIMRVLQWLPAPVTFVIVMAAMVPVVVVGGTVQLIHGFLHRPPSGTRRWSDEALRQFWADHRNGFLPGATEPAGGSVSAGTDEDPEGYWGEAIIGTQDIRPCQASGPSSHNHSNSFTTYRRLGGFPKDAVKLECSCGIPCSSADATYLIRMGSSMSAGPAVLLCAAHAAWFEANRLMGGGAGGVTAVVDATGLWRRSG